MTEPLRASPASPGSDRHGDSAPPELPPGQSAGAIMKAARERQGLHIAILAATIKVSPKKLEALEQDRHEELSNASFVRALAQSVCRSLKIDPRPVLALLPVPDPAALERSVGTLNAPFRDRPGRSESSMSTGTSRPALWAGALLLLGAAIVYFVPPQFWAAALRLPERTPAAGVTSTTATLPAVNVPTPVAETATLPAAAAELPGAAASAAAAVASSALATAPSTSFPTPPAAPEATTAAAAAPTTPGAGSAPAGSAGRLLLTANASSWVEVQDSGGKILISRTLAPGEAVDVDGAFPLRLKVGNAAGMQVALRGQAVDLSSYTRDNVARFELR